MRVKLLWRLCPAMPVPNPRRDVSTFGVSLIRATGSVEKGYLGVLGTEAAVSSFALEARVASETPPSPAKDDRKKSLRLISIWSSFHKQGANGLDDC